MATFYTAFQEQTPGASPPAGWTPRWHTAAAWDAFSDVMFSDGIGARAAAGSFYRYLSWDTVGSVGECEILVKVRFANAGHVLAVVHGSANTGTGYPAANVSGVFVRSSGANDLRLTRQHNGGAYVDINTVSSVGICPANTWLWVRLRAEPATNTYRAKIWEDGDPEPGTWTLEGTDSQYTSGYLGPAASGSAGGALYVDKVGAATAGDSAPTTGDPTAPGAFTAPLAAASFCSSEYTISWGTSTHPDGLPFTYRVELSQDGGATWPVTLATGLATNSYAVDLTPYDDGDGLKLRVRAEDSDGESAWTQSGLFFANPLVSAGQLKGMRCAKRQLIAGRRFEIHHEFQAVDGAGDVIDYSTWFIGARWTEGVDTKIRTITVELGYVAAGASLAPLLEASPRNTDGLGGYAPALYPGRWCRLRVAIVAAGESPVSADWVTMWIGRVDAVDFASTESITLSIRDLAGWLAETQIEAETTYSTPATPVEDLMQEILDASPAHPTDPVPTLVTIGDPDWHLDRHDQTQVRLWEALQALAEQIGWDLRYEYTASDPFALRLAEPRRDIVDPDTVWVPGEYVEVPVAQLNDSVVRNRLRLIHRNDAGVLVTSEYVNSTSAALFGNRWMQIAGAPVAAITNQPEADRLGPVILADVAFPEFDHAYRMPFIPYLMVGDYYGFAANDVHYDAQQDGGVVELQWELVAGGGWVTARTAGKPRGAYRGWLEKEDPRHPPEIKSYSLTHTPTGTLLIEVELSQSVAEWRAWLRAGSSPLSGGTPLDAYLVGWRKPQVLSITRPVENGTYYVVIRAIDAEGRVAQVEDDIVITGVGGGGGEPTTKPGTPHLERSTVAGGSQDADATWSNTNEVDALEGEWYVDGVSTGVFTGIAAGSTTLSDTFTIGERVKLRLRYTNGSGDGPWSNFSPEILLNGSV